MRETFKTFSWIKMAPQMELNKWPENENPKTSQEKGNFFFLKKKNIKIRNRKKRNCWKWKYWKQRKG